MSVKRITDKLGVPLTFLVILVVWEMVVRLFKVPVYVLPAPTAVVVELTTMWKLLLIQSIPTITAIIEGFILSTVVGVALGVGIAYSPTMEKTIYPTVVASQVVPKIALAPLFVVWFGFGMVPKIAMAFLIAFFPVLISTVVGMRAVDPEMIDMGKSMGGTQTSVFFKIRLPNALPSIFGGLKTAITLAVVGVIVGEFTGSSKGLGYLLVVNSGEMRTERVFANLIFLTFIGVVLFYAVEIIENRVIRWKRSSVLDFGENNKATM